MAHLEEIRNRVHLDINMVRNTEDTRIPGTYSGYDDTWNFNRFKKNFRVEIIERTDRVAEFDLIGVDTPFANAFRRIMIAEIPTMAIEEVFIYNNTSIMQDEVLAHRLGLLPIKVDPRLFEMKKESDKVSERNTLKFRLKIKCKKQKKGGVESSNPDDLYVNSKIYSRNIEWEPMGTQKEWISGNAHCFIINTEKMTTRKYSPCTL